MWGGLFTSLGIAPAFAVDPAVVFVKGKTTFTIGGATALVGFADQYRGSLSYGKVTVVRPKGATATKQQKAAAQAACMKLWLTGKSGSRPAFLIFQGLGTTFTKLSFMSSPFIMEANGRWISKGFNSNDPSRKVLAQGGFWDDLYGFRQTQAWTTFKFGKKKIQAVCDGDIAATADYPLKSETP